MNRLSLGPAAAFDRIRHVVAKQVPAAGMNSKTHLSTSELARLWSEAAVLGTHSAGCSCGGGFSVHVDPAMVEADILEYLADKYRGAGLTALAAFIRARSACPQPAFAIWLDGLDAAPLAPADLARLEADLATTLGSMGRHSD